MLLLTTLAFILSVAAGQTNNSSVSLPMCERYLCNCPFPNTVPGDMKYIAEVANGGCLCSCGREIGEACDVTDHCAIGSECIAPSDFSFVADRSMGICTDKCKRHQCDQYYECQLESNGHEKCACQTFRCSNKVNRPIAAQRLSGIGQIETTTFLNSCFMVNENCKLNRANAFTALWQRRVLIIGDEGHHHGSGFGSGEL